MTQPTQYDQLKIRLVAKPHAWLITGVAGFIGSNLLETLLKLNQRVVGLDNRERFDYTGRKSQWQEETVVSHATRARALREVGRT